MGVVVICIIYSSNYDIMKQELFFIYCYLGFYFFAVAYGWPHLFTLSSLFGGLHLDWFIHNSIPWNSDQDKSYKPSLGTTPPPPIYLAYHAGRWLLGWDFSPLHSYFIVRTASAKEVWWGQLISVCQPLILNFSKKKSLIIWLKCDAVSCRYVDHMMLMSTGTVLITLGFFQRG